MCGSSLCGNREIPRPTGRDEAARSASGRRGATADDVRTREVRLRHSVCLTVDASGGSDNVQNLSHFQD